MVEPYLISLIVYFIIFLITMMAVILICFISIWVISICEKTFDGDSLMIKGLVYASDLLIIGYIVIYLIHYLNQF